MRPQEPPSCPVNAGSDGLRSKRLLVAVESEIDVPGQQFADTLGRVLGDAGDEAYATDRDPLLLEQKPYPISVHTRL